MKKRPRKSFHAAATYVLLPLLAILPACTGTSTDESKEYAPLPRVEKPNVILVTLDTLRADHLGSYGHSTVHTPASDRLARDSILFTNAFSPTNGTNPSHASIHTGRLPAHHDVYDNRHSLPESIPTLAEQFQEKGYSTYAAVSVYHLNTDYSGLGRGFDEYINCGTAPRDGMDTVRLLTEKLGQAAAPVFVWLHMFDCHTPYAPPAPYERMYYRGTRVDPQEQALVDRLFRRVKENKRKYMRGWLGDTTDVAFPGSQYLGEVAYQDRSLGRFLSWFESRFDLDTTVTVVTADHGESFGEHRIFFDHGTLFTPDVHVPLLMQLPERFWAGRMVSEPTANLWLGHWVKNLAFEPADREGKNHYSDAHFDRLFASQSEPLVIESGMRRLKVLVEGSHKFVYDPERADGRIYNYQIDCFERTRLPMRRKEASYQRTLVEHLQAQNNENLADIIKQEEYVERLRALGYVE